MVNLPVLFTCLVATSAKVSSIFLATAGFTSEASASAAVSPPFDMGAPAFPAFIAFIAFMGAILRIRRVARNGSAELTELPM